MTADLEAHRLELLHVFKNTPEDIEANHAGRLGPGQVRRMRRAAVNAVLIMIGVVAVFIAIIIFVASRPISAVRWGLIVVVIVAGLAVGIRQGAKLRQSVREGQVECLSGPIRVTLRGRAGWWLAIADRSFHLPIRFWHVGPGLDYSVYVAPAAQLIVAMEPGVPPRLDLATVTGRRITFTHTGDGERPFTAMVDGVTLLVAVNDFPAEPLYSVFADGAHLTDLEDWPSGWIRPDPPAELLDQVARTPRGAALVALNPAAVGMWAKTLCVEPAADSDAVLRALRFDGVLVAGGGVRRLEPPAAQSVRTTISERDGELFLIEFTLGPTITRRALDAELGEGKELVRVHWDSDHCVLYPVRVPDAPFTCDIMASFREQPTPDAAAIEITLRRSRAT